DGYEIHVSNGGSFSARYLVVSAGSYTLSFAKQLGLGGDYVAFPVAGKFYTSPSVINGKVYTFQEEGVPFAATHADREWDGAVTRYGPTATPTLMFEKNRPDFKEFIDNLDPVLLDTVISKKAIRNIMIKNIAYSLPGVGRRLFWKYEARKIVPSIPYSDLKPAPEFRGVRTVGINKRTRELKLGEFTLPEVPEDVVNICANMAPTPAEVASGQQSGKAESRTSLARTLGRSTATLMTAAMIIGTGIFGAVGSATAKAGSGILVSMVLGGLIALATGISAAQLGVNY